MTPIEALELVTYLNRAGLLKVVKGTSDVWADVLSHTSAEDATAAARKIASERTTENAWVVPGDVLAAVRAIRNARINAVLQGAEPAPPAELVDDVARYNEWRRGFNRALGDGRTLHDAEVIAAEAAGIPPVHRAIDVHRFPMFKRLESA